MDPEAVVDFRIEEESLRNDAQREYLNRYPNWWDVKPAPPPVTLPRIYFARWRVNGTSQIWAMNPDGTNQTNLSNSTTVDGTPTVAPTSRHVAFSRSGRIWVMNGDGTSQHPVTTPPAGTWDTEPAWSRDGTQIAFNRSYQIWIVKENGTGLRPLMNYAALSPFALHHAPTWNANGTEIAFWREQGGTSSIMAASTAVGSTTPASYLTLPSPNRFDGWPAWSPDGLTVAFWRNDYTQAAIWIVGANGDPFSEHNISNPDYAHGVSDRAPCWSPTGGEIAFMRTNYVDYNVWTMKSDGTGQRNVSTGPGGHIDEFPDWQ